jgi:hypothetical protein
MDTRTKTQSQIWSAPNKTEKFNRVWENIKAETKAMVQNERFRKADREQNTKRATLN